jgi:Tfp pilus assembly protein PilO
MAAVKASTQLTRKYIYQMSKAYRARADVRVFTELILSLVAVIVFTTSAIKLTLATIGELRNEINEKEKVAQALDTKINNLVEAKAYYDANQTAINLLQSAIPDLSLPAQEIRQMEGTAKKNNVQITGLNIEEVPLYQNESEAGVKNIEFSLNATGEYSSLIAFLGELELLRRPIVSNSVTISITENEEGLLMTIESITPYFPISQ